MKYKLFIQVQFWLISFLGIILTQNGVLSSPLSVFDDWESFNEMLRDSSFRLPSTTTPKHYEVSLTPYFEEAPVGTLPFTFSGDVAIDIEATESDVSSIVMHCNDLVITSVRVFMVDNDVEVPLDLVNPAVIPQCEPVYSFLTINTVEALQLNQLYKVRMEFTGNLQTNMRGFYRSWYYDSSGSKRWMGTTQFQPGHARQAFPCYDEPNFKATFDITINREEDFSETISNMPIKDTNLVNGRIAETFHTTPVMSTYLIAFIVSHYKVVASTTDLTRPFDIYARDNVGATGEWSLEIGEKLLNAMEIYTAIPYYTMQDHMDMKQAAIPDFSAGAMENWGLLTYREALILYDPDNSNHFYKQRVANIVSHEITHMWFGNLVTCAWWDNLWLNEGFARFYTYFLTDSVAPELGYEIRFIIEQVQTALFSDSVDNAHPLTDPTVSDPASVSGHFSHITYARGASVIRMTQHLLGRDTYQKGLRIYLNERKYDVAEPDHLFDAWDIAAQEDEALVTYGGITISEYFKTWSEKAGHPLLTVSINQRTGEMTVVQERWERTTGESQVSSLWHVPITWTRGGQPDFEDLKPTTILTGYSSMLQRGTEGLEWVVFNKQQAGFYRINYDNDNWGLLTLALRSDERTVIHEINRAQIVDDLFALARAGVRPYTEAFNILSFLQYEDAYAPWLAAISGFNFVRRRLAHDPDNLQKLHDLIIELSVAVTTRLGYSELETDSFMDGLLRMYVMTFLCNVGHEQCVAAAISNFRAFVDNNTPIPANMRPWVYCTGLRNGNAADFDFLWNKYVNDDLANEKLVLLEALGCTRDENSLRTYLDVIVSGNDDIRPQDYNTGLNSVTSGNEENTLIAFSWLRDNLSDATETLGSVATLLNYISGRLLYDDDIREFEEWLESNQGQLGGAYNTGVNGAASARANLDWSDQRLAELTQYFENGFQEVEIDFEVVTEGPTTTESDANVARIAVVTLFITLSLYVITF